MRTIAMTVALLCLVACGQSDATRERSYIARCIALGIPRGSEQFERCRSWLESVDPQPQTEARRGL